MIANQYYELSNAKCFTVFCALQPNPCDFMDHWHVLHIYILIGRNIQEVEIAISNCCNDVPIDQSEYFSNCFPRQVPSIIVINIHILIVHQDAFIFQKKNVENSKLTIYSCIVYNLDSCQPSLFLHLALFLFNKFFGLIIVHSFVFIKLDDVFIVSSHNF